MALHYVGRVVLTGSEWAELFFTGATTKCSNGKLQNLIPKHAILNKITVCIALPHCIGHGNILSVNARVRECPLSL